MSPGDVDGADGPAGEVGGHRDEVCCERTGDPQRAPADGQGRNAAVIVATPTVPPEEHLAGDEPEHEPSTGMFRETELFVSKWSTTVTVRGNGSDIVEHVCGPHDPLSDRSRVAVRTVGGHASPQ